MVSVSKTFFFIARVLIFFNQILSLAPIVYRRPCPYRLRRRRSRSRRHHRRIQCVFRTHRVVTFCATITCLSLALTAPVFVPISTTLYSEMGVHVDSLFNLIAMATIAFNVAISLLIMATLIWQRRRLSQLLNLLNEIVARLSDFEPDFVKWNILLLLLLKLALALYLYLISFPFLLNNEHRLDALHLSAAILTLFVQNFGCCIFAASIFTVILLLTACFQQLKASLEVANNGELSQLASLIDSLHAAVELFTQTFQIGIFLLLLSNFLSVLTNVYAMLYFYATLHSLSANMAYFCAFISIDLYSLIFVCHLCVESQERAKYLLLRRDDAILSQSDISVLTHSSPLWPRSKQFWILGLFCLNHEFWLYLVSYSVNFFVIILQFGINKY